MSKRTWGFKKGNLPWTARPIGYERVFSDGYLRRKVSNTRNVGKDWKLVHVLLWEQHNGSVPDKHAVIFADSDKKNIAIENLRLISRKELLDRNSIHRYPVELKGAIHVLGRLKRTIHEKQN